LRPLPGPQDLPSASRPISLSTVPPVPAFIRARGEIRAEFSCLKGSTHLARHFEGGGFRLRVPRRDASRGASGVEGVLINTGGGLVGGDTGAIDVALGEDARVTLTTQSAEKIYGSEGPQTRLDVELHLGARAVLEWLPQETILFKDANFARSLHIDMPGSASLTLLESVILGRKASGEAAVSGRLRDNWHIYRDKRLVFAESLALGPHLETQLARKAVTGGAISIATFLHVSEGAESRLDEVRAALAAAECECAASAWNGMLVARFLASEPHHLRRAAQTLLAQFRGQDAPRIWT